MIFSKKNNIQYIRDDLFGEGGLFYVMTKSKWANFKKQFLLASRTSDNRTLTSQAKSAFTSRSPSPMNFFKTSRETIINQFYKNVLSPIYDNKVGWDNLKLTFIKLSETHSLNISNLIPIKLQYSSTSKFEDFIYVIYLRG